MSGGQTICFLDLVNPHREMAEELVAIFRQALKTASFVGGPMVQEFEHAFAEFCGTSYCVGVGSGTDAVRFALIAAGVRPGDSVLTVPNTFIATVEAICQAGAMPEFVDVDEHTYTMDPRKLREYLEDGCTREAGGGVISRRTGRRVTAVVPVHLYGQTADMDPILQMAQEYDLLIIEDACQAHGAEYFSAKTDKWCRAGSIGHAAAFSFYPGKNLGACGEAGAVTTNSGDVAAKVSMLRDHGQAKKYYHDVEGYNGRLDAIQAGILSAKLRRLPDWSGRRRQAAERYRQLLAGETDVILPFEPSYSRAVYHLFVIRVEARDELIRHLAAQGIGAAIHYPIPLHLQDACRVLNYLQGDLPVSERVCRKIVSLPMHSHLTTEQQQRVCEQIVSFVRSRLSVLPCDEDFFHQHGCGFM